MLTIFHHYACKGHGINFFIEIFFIQIFLYRLQAIVTGMYFLEILNHIEQKYMIKCILDFGLFVSWIRDHFKKFGMEWNFYPSTGMFCFFEVWSVLC